MGQWCCPNSGGKWQIFNPYTSVFFARLIVRFKRCSHGATNGRFAAPSRKSRILNVGGGIAAQELCGLSRKVRVAGRRLRPRSSADSRRSGCELAAHLLAIQVLAVQVLPAEDVFLAQDLCDLQSLFPVDLGLEAHERDAAA